MGFRDQGLGIKADESALSSKANRHVPHGLPER